MTIWYSYSYTSR